MKPVGHANYNPGTVAFLLVPHLAKGCYKYLLKE